MHFYKISQVNRYIRRMMKVLVRENWFEDDARIASLRKRLKGFDSIADNLIKLRNILRNIYGENYSISLYVRRGNSEYRYSYSGKHAVYRAEVLKQVEVTIHYPELVVNNRDNKTVTLNNFFINCTLDMEDTVTVMFDEDMDCHFRAATTGTLTSEMYHVGYIHSHVPTASDCDDFVNFRKFCTGAGEINNVIGMLNSYGPGDYEWNMLSLLFMQLNMTVGYEALEGTTYIKMKDIVSGTSVGDLHSHSIKTFYSYMMDYYLSYPTRRKRIDFRFSGDKIVVVDNDNLEEFLRYMGEDEDLYNYSDIAHKSVSGQYFKYNSIPSIPSDASDYTVTFRGQEYPLTIEQPDDTSGRKLFIHPLIKEYVITRLESRLQQQKIKRSLLVKHSRVNHNSALPEPS